LQHKHWLLKGNTNRDYWLLTSHWASVTINKTSETEYHIHYDYEYQRKTKTNSIKFWL